MHERAVCASRPRPAYAASCARILYTPHLARDVAPTLLSRHFFSVSSGLPAITTTHICDRVMDLGNRLGQEPTQHTRQHRRTDATLTDRPLLIAIVIPCSAYKHLHDFEQRPSFLCLSPLCALLPAAGLKAASWCAPPHPHPTQATSGVCCTGLDHSSSLTHTHFSCSAITHTGLNLLEQIFRASVHRPFSHGRPVDVFTSLSTCQSQCVCACEKRVAGVSGDARCQCVYC